MLICPLFIMTQGQESQFSDTQPSSFCDVDIIDNIHLPLSDDLTAEPFFSQQTVNSATSSTTDLFAQSCLIIPSCLQKICPDRINTYVLYSNMAKDDYVQWWLQTDFGRKKKIRWDARHQAEVWKQFEQVANANNGAPKVICKQCKAVLDHPGIGNGTSAMIKHTKGQGCQRSGKPGDIKQFMRNAVSSIIKRLETNKDYILILLLYRLQRLL